MPNENIGLDLNDYSEETRESVVYQSADNRIVVARNINDFCAGRGFGYDVFFGDKENQGNLYIHAGCLNELLLTGEGKGRSVEDTISMLENGNKNMAKFRLEKTGVDPRDLIIGLSHARYSELETRFSFYMKELAKIDAEANSF